MCVERVEVVGARTGDERGRQLTLELVTCRLRWRIELVGRAELEQCGLVERENAVADVAPVVTLAHADEKEVGTLLAHSADHVAEETHPSAAPG